MRQRLSLAAGLSLALHLVVFLLLLRLSGAAREAPRPRPLLVEVLERPARTAKRQRPLPGHPTGAPQPKTPAAASGPGARGPGADDVPRAPLDLFPEGALALAAPAPPAPEAADAGSPAEIIAARVQGWRLGALAEYRVAVGVDSYFSTLAHALRDGLGAAAPPGSPRHGTPSAGQRFLQGWLAGLAEADGPADAARGERGPTQPQHDVGGREADALRRLLGPMAPTQESLVAPFELFRKTQLPPAAVLRLEQDADGQLTRVALVASSGDAGFDAWVQRSAALALSAMPKPPESGAGLHPDGTRSEWAFFRSGDAVSVLLLRVY
jgi:TonB C terminal